ncbi:hypothetical protein K470DRAFT_270821 [Piedraia hortae CBS 480.64]|uniref:TOM core complex subunit Tom6 n=1 Tax=Piedraia hortae CBS 480.64 TaxID=1314780 RepID=A0A6A7BZ06_9PEZI|nr:hypothetical protein K470DRAFT_270821 [Piedraia hortae CBS 480.64]
MPRPIPSSRAIGTTQRGGGSFTDKAREMAESPEYRNIAKSIAFFAVGVAFLHSSWSELLLPPYVSLKNDCNKY